LRSRPEGKLRIGVPRTYFYDELDEEVAAAVEDALKLMEQLVGKLHDVDLRPDTDRTLQAVEAYEFHRESVAKTPHLYHPETLRRIKTGEGVKHEAYLRCRAELGAARKGAGKMFETIDVFVTPTTPIVAPAIAELQEKPELLRPRELLLLRNTRPVNVWGLPAISVPCAFTRTGLPIGLQIIGPPGREDIVLQAAHVYEQATAWHEREAGL
jgi:Asp-tRNA(Asn)/Glu-tRNA(Gln) amidotransferase A subunit family amidase